MKREVHAERAEEPEDRPDPAGENGVGAAQEAQALGEVRAADEGHRLRVRDPPAREEHHREEREGPGRIRGFQDLAPADPDVDARRAGGEDRERARDHRDAVQPRKRPSRARAGRRRGGDRHARRLGREEDGRERKEEDQQSREETAFVRGGPFLESPPRAVPRVHVEPVLRAGGQLAHLVDAAGVAVELRGLLVGKEERKERHAGDAECEGRAFQSRPVPRGAAAEPEREARRRERDERQDEPVDDGQPVQEERRPEPGRAARSPLADEEDERLEEDRDPAREQVGEVRHLAEAVRHEGERDARDPCGAGRARQRSREPERRVAREREPEKHREAVDGQRAHPERQRREEQHRDAVIVLAEGEAVLHREEDVPVEEVQGVVERLEVVPPERPGDEIRIACVRRVVAEVQHPRPRHDDRQAREREEHESLARERAARGRTVGHRRDSIGAFEPRVRRRACPQPGAQRESEKEPERKRELQQQPVPRGMDLLHAAPGRQQERADVEREAAADRGEEGRRDAAPRPRYAGEERDARGETEARPVLPRRRLGGDDGREERKARRGLLREGDRAQLARVVLVPALGNLRLPRVEGHAGDEDAGPPRSRRRAGGAGGSHRGRTRPRRHRRGARRRRRAAPRSS